MPPERGSCRANCGSILSALFTRVVFTVHCFLAFLQVVINVSWNHFYFLLLTGLGALFIETIITLKVRKGAEYLW